VRLPAYCGICLGSTCGSVLIAQGDVASGRRPFLEGVACYQDGLQIVFDSQAHNCTTEVACHVLRSHLRHEQLAIAAWRFECSSGLCCSGPQGVGWRSWGCYFRALVGVGDVSQHWWQNCSFGCTSGLRLQRDLFGGLGRGAFASLFDLREHCFSLRPSMIGRHFQALPFR
jgi:hypothetical protein